MRLACRMLLLALLMVALAAPGQAKTTAQGIGPRPLPGAGHLRMAYYYPPDPTSLASLRANISRLDIVAPHWLTIDGAGLVDIDERPDAVAFLRVSSAVVLPSVMVTSPQAGHRILSDPAVRATAIENLLAAVATWDGLALDFEGLDPADRADLSSFVPALGAALREAGKYYAVALPAKTSDVRTGWSGAYDYAAIASAADLYLVMAYGWRTSSSREPGSTAPLSWVDAAMQYAARELPPDRLLLGVPFYGYDWNLAQGPPARALRHADTRQLLGRLGMQPSYDAEVGSATFRYRESGEAHEVWYEDAQSLGAKLDLVAKYRLRGVGAWRLGQEDPDAWAAWDRLLSPAPVPNPPTAPAPPPPTPGGSELPTAATVAARSGWLPTLWGGAGAELALRVTNPNPAATSVDFTLLFDDGSRARFTRSVEPRQVATFELGGRGTGDAALGFTTPAPVGVELITRRADGATSTVSPREPARRLIFPDGQSAPGVETSLAILNPGAIATSLTIRARADTGLVVWERSATLDGGKRTSIVAPATSESATYWLEVAAEAPVVAARQTRLPGAAQVDPGLADPASRWAMPNASLGDGWLSYLVLANPNAVASSARIRWTTDGRELDDRTITIPAMGRASVEASGALGQAVAAADITATQPIAVARSAYERNGVGATTEPAIPQEPVR